MKEIGFIGDIHGCVDELDRLVTRVRQSVFQLVFLGDYVNRGPNSRGVIEYLLDLQRSCDISTRFIRGNHDEAFLSAITGSGFDNFLRMGGASTVTSYIGAPRTDVRAQFCSSIPLPHIEFLKTLEDQVVLENVVATHQFGPTSNDLDLENEDRFSIVGHSPQNGRIPVLQANRAFIDTGCGTLDGGRLTCLFWPSLRWVQYPTTTTESTPRSG